MDLSRVFSVFSRRPEAATKLEHEVPTTTRSRICQWWARQIGGSMVSRDIWDSFWIEILNILQIRLGTPSINQAQTVRQTRPAPHDAMKFVMEGPGERFLDFLEDLFHTTIYQGSGVNADNFIAELNQLLRVDDLPYHLTGFAIEHSESEERGRKFHSVRIIAFPKVIMRESEVMHANAMEPTLQLLRNPVFANANTEFLSALEDYRRGEYSDCLTKCGSSFESFMKIVCDKKGCPCKQTDTASALIKTLLANTNLEPYFEPLLIIVATLRNRLSSAHGTGTTAKTVPQHLARYAINVTGSAMILLSDETSVA